MVDSDLLASYRRTHTAVAREGVPLARTDWDPVCLGGAKGLPLHYNRVKPAPTPLTEEFTVRAGATAGSHARLAAGVVCRSWGAGRLTSHAHMRVRVCVHRRSSSSLVQRLPRHLQSALSPAARSCVLWRTAEPAR